MPATDDFVSYDNAPFAPLTRAEAVTPHNTNELARVSRAVWIGGAGAIAVVLSSGDEVTISAIPAGTMLNIRAKQIKSTGTTATNIVALS